MGVDIIRPGVKEGLHPLRNFTDITQRRWEESGSLLCVGIDPHPSVLPLHFFEKYSPDSYGLASAYYDFGEQIIMATAPNACAFKINPSFFDELGDPGRLALTEVLKFARRNFPNIPMIYDRKFTEVEHTASVNASTAFNTMMTDATTVVPYLGQDSISPFLEYSNKGTFVVANSSNSGSADLQTRVLHDTRLPVWKDMVRRSKKWGQSSPHYVVGANNVRTLKEIRSEIGDDSWILIPGIGAQDGNIDDLIPALDSHNTGIFVNISRGLYGSKGTDFAIFARNLSKRYKDLINETRTGKVFAVELPPTREEIVRQIIEDNGVLIDGHFKLASGMHSNKYVEKSKILRRPEVTSTLGQMIAEDFKDQQIDTVLGPERGAVTLAHEVAQHLSNGVVAVSAQKSESGEFTISPKYMGEIQGKNVLVVEDVINTGGSTEKVLKLVIQNGGSIVGLGAVVNRGNEDKIDGVPINALLKLQLENFLPDECPMCKGNIPTDEAVGRGSNR